jgi:hypothetical protein
MIDVFAHEKKIKKFLDTRQRLQALIFERSKRRKDAEVNRYNENIRKCNFRIEDLIMIYQKNIEKFESR